MDDLTPREKWSLTVKLLEFKKMGLVSYGKYLDKELEHSAPMANRRKYTEYIEKEISRNEKKLKKIEAKLSAEKPE